MSEPFPYTPVRTFMLYVTEECNLRCKYCFVEKRPRRMTRETALRAVDFFFSQDASGAAYDLQLNFFGGEPFLEVDLMEQVCRYAVAPRPNNSRRTLLAVTTNGTLFGPRIEALLRQFRMHVLLSLDGGPEVTAADRPYVSGRSSYATAAGNLRRFVDAAADVMVRTTFHPGALDLVGRVEHLLAAGAPRIALCPVMESDWEPHVGALERAYEALGDWMIARSGPDGIPPLEVTRQLLLDWHRARQGQARPRRPCRVGHSLLGVDPEGNVMPCHRFLYRPQDWLGSVGQPEVFSHKRREFVELDSSRMAEACRGCVAEPICGGGCRLVALDRGLGLHDVHPGHCLPMRAHVRMVARLYECLLESGGLRAVLRPPSLPEAHEAILN